MTKLHNIIARQEHEQYAMNEGVEAHTKLRRVFIDKEITNGDSVYIDKIQTRDDLRPFFVKNSRTEVPIAGTVNGHFISRRIDRLVVDDMNQTILVLDYKTDINRDAFRDRYYAQIREYNELLKAIYPTYKIMGYILWTHDFSLENVPMKQV